MATTQGRPIDAAYLLTQLKNFDSQILNNKYNEKFQFATMPAASADYASKLVQYIGESNATYTKGFFYKAVKAADSDTYSWTAISQSAPEYSIKKLDAATDGFAASYSLTKDNVEVGTVIDIPKDFFVTDAFTAVVLEADKAEGGKFADNTKFAVGDTYIQLDVSLKDKTEPKPVYINVSELIDIYTAGDGIAIDTASNNKVSVKLAADGGLKFADLAAGETEKSIALNLETENIDFTTEWA